MPFEIERKFLVADESWRKLCTRSKRLRDGLLATSTDGRKVRVRIYEERATLTVKTKREGPTRAEFEYEIPIDDAEALITHCGDYVLTKTRYYVPHEGFTWEIDIYDGILSDVVIAEVELEDGQADVPLPPWIGREVTGNPDYRKINMLRDRLERATGHSPSDQSK